MPAEEKVSLLTKMREARGLSMRQAATLCEMSAQGWCNLEGGKANPRLSTLRRIGIAFNLSTKDILSLYQGM
jgi:transcriptional regulator with XRE-family HTH domain